MIIGLIKGEISQKDVLAYYNANITYKELPMGIDGFVFNYKGIYNIIINICLSYYKKRKAIVHELAHIELNHMCQTDKDLFAFHITQYEDEADKYIKFLLDK